MQLPIASPVEPPAEPNLSVSLRNLPPPGPFLGAAAVRQISATNDLEAILDWLKESARRSKATFENYRKEAERLLIWATVSRQKGLTGLTRDDMADYDSFLRNPQPADLWAGPRKPRAHPKWKPFAGPLKPSSVEQAFFVLKAMFGYLHGVGYLSVNVLDKSKLGRNETADRADQLRERYLPEAAWNYLMDFVDRMPMRNPRERAHVIRAKWILTLLYETAARRGEIPLSKMSHFTCDPDGTRWLKLLGKGNKVRSVPVSSRLHDMMIVYRTEFGLSPLPSPREDTDLVLSITGRKGVSDEMLLRVIKEIVKRAAAEIKDSDPHMSELIGKTTAHWLRHSKATHVVNRGTDIRSMQKMLGHAKVVTTMLYQHIDRGQMHEDITGENHAGTGAPATV